MKNLYFSILITLTCFVFVNGQTSDNPWAISIGANLVSVQDDAVDSKIGFGVPVRQWINNELREMIGDLLSEETVNSRGIFDSKKIQQILEKNRTGRIDASYTIIALLGLEIWFRNFADK